MAADVIDTVLSAVDEESEYQTARRLAERKLRSMTRLEPPVQTRRLAGLLARKGYSPSLTYRVVREVVGNSDQLEDAQCSDDAAGLS